MLYVTGIQLLYSYIYYIPFFASESHRASFSHMCFNLAWDDYMEKLIQKRAREAKSRKITVRYPAIYEL